jgi:hypothetical protein
MEYPTKRDPVVMDELAYDRQCEANQLRMDRCREEAFHEYENGELDKQIHEWLIDDNPDDMAHLALAVITGIDTKDMDLWLSRESLSISSIRSTIEAVIENRAEEMYHSGENY